ncbi:hypothetical protein J2S17_004587 [Cytobacillus purgationiresistens]|uniref:Uncharacterized protein n=1 Tax=Cytobacillus purgationiresistens TaxID=863449 RepID=A0ABU0AN44_9BACI|nr:hypothetical protein [Cytobacillus purgationiresistens]
MILRSQETKSKKQRRKSKFSHFSKIK